MQSGDCSTYLAGRVSGVAIWGMYAALWGYFAWPSCGIGAGVFAGIAFVWMAVSLLSLVDLQFGDRNSTTGIPPRNLFFHPGQAFPLRYHYFWLILCSPGGDQVGEPCSGAPFWCGFGGIGSARDSGRSREFRNRFLRRTRKWKRPVYRPPCATSVAGRNCGLTRITRGIDPVRISSEPAGQFRHSSPRLRNQR